ncbi:cytochrome C1 heme lyase [Epithele typhae]|uniref:cytochrome C1 heme lyase n=1 Tax=Epithele typhae TaxID=378194 RepID=UPI002008D414|nr:cytochrome C1 heme lyase [Epithele typhae]KAH9946238.1 cytochrome C1 heme lyase [Epithele typhae]
MSSSTDTSSSVDKCPVDHRAFTTSSPSSSSSSAASAEKCPVDHTQRSSWSSILGRQRSGDGDAAELPDTPAAPAGLKLPQDRETSSIPRADGGNWVYPSQAQFFAAMARKNHDPRAADMQVVVPIHNAVNERAWGEIMSWEARRGGEQCGGVKLISFKGRPGDLSPRARWYSILGFSPPFDRHDWVVDRCGTRMRYVIDFYSGHTKEPSQNVSFFLDVRPALDSWEGVRMRTERFWSQAFRRFGGDTTPQQNSPPTRP